MKISVRRPLVIALDEIRIPNADVVHVIFESSAIADPTEFKVCNVAAAVVPVSKGILTVSCTTAGVPRTSMTNPSRSSFDFSFRRFTEMSVDSNSLNVRKANSRNVEPPG
jgi:hypothetical protein